MKPAQKLDDSAITLLGDDGGDKYCANKIGEHGERVFVPDE